MNVNSKYARNIRRLMAEQNISYGTLSQRSGIPKSALQRYATGETENIPINRIEALAQAFHVPPATMFNWGDERKESSMDETLEEVIHIFRALSPKFQSIGLEHLRSLKKADQS